MRLYGRYTVLANACKTRIIAEAKIKSDKLDTETLLAESGFDIWVVWFIKRVQKNRTFFQNKEVHTLLDTYEYKTELTDLFGRSGMS